MDGILEGKDVPPQIAASLHHGLTEHAQDLPMVHSGLGSLVLMERVTASKAMNGIDRNFAYPLQLSTG